MKKTAKICSFVIISLLAGVADFAYPGLKFAPYSAIDVSLGMTTPSKGEILFTSNINTDLGAISKFSKHSLFFLYELKYLGPGLKKTEGREFTERTLDNIFFLQYQSDLNEKFSLKTRLNVMTELVRSGANEAWGGGLYDFNRTGLYAELTMNKVWAGSFSYDKFDFPNYTDLLTEYQVAQGESVGINAAGKESQNFIQVGISRQLGVNSIAFKEGIQLYTSQKVVNLTGGYSSSMQTDNLTEITLSRSQKIARFGIIEPSFNYKIKSSNQNFLLFEQIGISTSAFVPMEHYYDYSEMDIVLPLTVRLTENKSVFLVPEYDMKQYSSRQPRDKNNKPITSEKQQNTLILLTLGYTVKWNDVSKWSLIYNYQSQVSNMKFEQYVPYNYTGHYIGMNFNFSY